MRKRRRPKDAKRTTVYLSAEERALLALIEVRRSKREEKGDSPSEIIADALWHYWTDIEKMPREKIEELLPELPEDQQPSNVKEFPKKNGN